MSQSAHANGLEGIAVIGMSGRFPGAQSPEEFWQNLRNGLESITFFSEEELQQAGVDPALLQNPNYVRARGVLEAVEDWDPEFFGLTPREAATTDPQHRLFLECAWEAMERAGYEPGSYQGAVGVYAGAGHNSYAVTSLYPSEELMRTLGPLQLLIGNEKDHLPTRVSYKLNLTGPSLNVQTACSTSLVAVALACQNLLTYQCDMALAGGVSITVPQRSGYLYQEGGIASPDGHCRPFDADSKGTVPGNGVGVVVLKRLADAIADGDTVHAVIRGFGINNDGSLKAGYTAPGVEGQAGVIRMAQMLADAEPETITYIETHGTATELGDPIEIAALTQAFRAGTSNTGFCAIDSVKANVGHLDTAAGVAGLIKTVMALKHRELPPSIHFRAPNPKLNLEQSPFFVSNQLRPWDAGGLPLRAGVSSFGVGGTNVHVVLEEAPAMEPSDPACGEQLLLLSARSEAALEAMTENLAAHLGANPTINLADAAYTLQVGRSRFQHRRALVCRNAAEAAEALAKRDSSRLLSGVSKAEKTPVAFLFPGQGAQHPNMARGLYESDEPFRKEIDRCADLLRPHLGLDLRQALFPRPGQEEEAARLLEQTWLSQPALFTVEYALARLLESRGIQPEAMLGHSIGEYVAACLAGVFSLADGLALVSSRGKLMQQAPAGAMLAVMMNEAELRPLLGDDLVLAAVNSPASCVAAGPASAIAGLEERLQAAGVKCRLLRTSHAFHSPLIDVAVAPFVERVRQVRLSAPRIRFLSNLTGDWITAAEATSPEYWGRHLREAVRFEANLTKLLAEPELVLLEVGPGRALGSFVRQHPAYGIGHTPLTLLSHAQEQAIDMDCLLAGIGRAWLAGVNLDWSAWYEGQRRRRIQLPTYPFERRRCWIEPRQQRALPGVEEEVAVTAEWVEEGQRVVAANSRPSLPTLYAPPSSERERQAIRLWEELLGISPIGVHDNFFELGGHSLLAVQITDRLRSLWQVDLTLQALFQTPTVAGLARRAEEAGAQEGSAVGAQPMIVPDTARQTEPFPLTEIQQAYWIGRSDSFDLGNVGTHLYLELERTGLDLGACSRALNRLIRRHDMLRAVVRPDGQQQVLGADQVPFYEIAVDDLTQLSSAEAEARLAETRTAMTFQVLRPDQWPLFQVRASRAAGGRIRLHLVLDYLITDAFSMDIFIAEWALLCERPDAELPPLSLTFRDYVLATESFRETEAYKRAEQYWQNRLPDLPPPPQLPVAVVQSGEAAPRLVRLTGGLGPAAWEQLKQLGSRLGVTPSAVLCSAFADVLATWAQSPRFTINLTLFNRLPLHPQVEKILGDFTSTVLLEVDASAAQFEDRVLRLQQQLWADLDHRQVGGVRVLRELTRLHRDPSKAIMPFVFTSLLVQGQEGHSSSAGALGEVVYTASQTPQILVDCQVMEEGGALHFAWDVLEGAFPPNLIRSAFAAFCEWLQRLADDPQTWQAGGLALVPAAQLEKRALVNATEAPLSDALLQLPFEEQARLRPDQTAVIASGRRLTYGELLAFTTRLARRLRRMGARPGALIGVVMEKGWEQVAAALAILQAGAAYLPVDPALPRDRVWYLLRHSDVRIILTQSGWDQTLEWPDEVERLAVNTCDLSGESTEPLEPVQRPEDLAYVIFTSGSTGLPKGVMIDHRGAVNTVLDINLRFGMNPSDRVLAISALNFDLSVWDIFGTLAAGGTIVMPDARHLRDPAHWVSLVKQEGVTIWNSVPALVSLLVEHAAAAGGASGHSLRLVMMSGDWIPVGLPGAIRGLLGPIELYSLGGATEASIWSILYPIGDVDPSWKSIPYGKPMVNQHFHVLNERLEPRPVWVPGDLYIGGVGLAKGYWKDSEKTAASFIIHPRTGVRLYRTGDLGRYLPDGQIEFLGRVDQQVKVRGYRIELGEIEAVLRQHPQVEEAIVLVRDEGGDRRLVACVLPKPATERPDVADLRTLAKAKLPDYMIPSNFVLIDALPLTANGKVDRKALLELDTGGASERDAFVAPHNEVEELLAGWFAQVLNQERVGVLNNFFDLGGHSLLATRLVTKIREVFEIQVPLRALFEEPTVAGLSEVLRSLEPEPGRVEATARLRRMIDTMSPEEIAALLAAESEE